MSKSIAIRKFLLLRKFIRKELKTPFHVPFSKRIFAWKNGFLSESNVIYKLSSENVKSYLPDLKRFIHGPFVSSTHGILLDNKLIFSEIFESIVNVPPVWGYVNKGQYFCVKNQISPKDADAFYASVLMVEGIVCKPNSGGGGDGVAVFSTIDSAVVYKGEKLSAQKLASIVLGYKDFIVTQKIEQGHFASSFNSNSINSIRILTMVDPVSLEPFIATAVFRIGTKKSGNVDNWSSGGMSCNIDLETGVLSEGITYPYNGVLQRFENHPDSNAQLKGTEVPNWENIKTEILKIALKVNYIPYVGWDVVHQGDQILILEGNTNSDVNLLQVHKPLLVNEKVKRFYNYYKVI